MGPLGQQNLDFCFSCMCPLIDDYKFRHDIVKVVRRILSPSAHGSTTTLTMLHCNCHQQKDRETKNRHQTKACNSTYM